MANISDYLGVHIHSNSDNFRMDLRETGWEGRDWIHLGQDKDQW
jgi:hypothetical protein